MRNSSARFAVAMWMGALLRVVALPLRNACNLSWLVQYLLGVATSAERGGLWAAVTAPSEFASVSPVALDNLRMVGLMFTAIAIAWAVSRARRASDIWLIAGVGAFSVHAYATLAIAVHENHVFAAVPLLAVAAAGRRRFAPILAATSATLALNLNLFYGLGDNVGYAIPRSVTWIDLSVLVAALNCGIFIWHSAVLKAECSRAVDASSTAIPTLQSATEVATVL